LKKIMKKLYLVILFSLAAQLQLGNPAAAGADTENLPGIFDGSARKFVMQSLVLSYEVPVPLRPEVIHSPGARRKFLYQILADQEKRKEKKFYTPNEIAAMIREDYGNTPSEEDKKQIEKALAVLQNTKFGADMCKAVAYRCDIESLEKAGIRLRVKEIVYGSNQSASGAVPPPIYYAGRTFIGLGKNDVSSAASPKRLALTILHEMSHVEDLRKNKRGTMAKAMYASDEKALMNEIAGYDEISRKYPGFSDSFCGFLVEVWAWKNESGPYPKHQFFTLPLGPGGMPMAVSSGDLLKNYMPGLSFWNSMQRLVYALWHGAYGDPKVDDELVKAIRRAAWEKSASYKGWRQNPAETAPTVAAPAPTPTPPAPKPPKPPTPHDTDDGGSGSSGGSGSGGGFNPGTYDPHFGDGI